MTKMGLAAIYPKPKPTGIDKPSKTYPYLLKGLSIIRPNQVWATDITYIRLSNGFVYLVAVMDWFSRYVLSWELSNSLDVYFCLSALDRALSQSRPLIFNNDQGSQFTSDAFTDRLQAANIAISWDGRGSYFDNIFIERLWRSVKYEEVYLNDYDSVTTASRRLRTTSTFTINSGFINRSIIEHPTRCISNKFWRFTRTELLRFSILNLIHCCLKDGGKFRYRLLQSLHLSVLLCILAWQANSTTKRLITPLQAYDS